MAHDSAARKGNARFAVWGTAIVCWCLGMAGAARADSGSGEGSSTPAAPRIDCDALDLVAGRCGEPGHDYASHWLQEKLEELTRPRVDVVFPPEPEGQVVVGKNRRVSGAVTDSLSEATIAVSPVNPKLIAVGANSSAAGQFRQRMFVSKDGGKVFRGSVLPSTLPGMFLQGDPSAAWTTDGTLWATTVEGASGVGGLQLNGESYRSSNQGQTWVPGGRFSGTEKVSDRPTVVADTSTTSRFRDSLYVTWHNGPVFVTRRKKGAAKWAKPVRVSPTDTQGFGGDIELDVDGRLSVFWPDSVRKQIFVATSNDGGVHFSAPVLISNVEKPLFDLNVAAAGRSPTFHVNAATLQLAGVRRSFVVWFDPATAPGTGARIYFSRSSDGGATWSPRREVRSFDGAVDQFHPALAIDPSTGRLWLSYTDTSADPAGLQTHRVMLSSTDFGDTWSEPLRLSQQPSNVLTEPKQIYGDYQAVSAVSGGGGRAWAVWTDRRSAAASSIWMAEVKATESGVALEEALGEPGRP